ncbi:MAG: hypothetical protein IMF14_02230, partial [Proteobacteria bacterium]|nr:hypothetical protein [Pseudomonadota bacterium]
MIKGNINHWIGIVLLISVISFLFYKTIFSDLPLTETVGAIEEIHYLQVQLHRDLLRYRSNQIQQYDTLNKTLSALETNIAALADSNIPEEDIGIRTIEALDRSIHDQSELVEDFKTHHSILQNSLLYIFNASTDLYSVKPKTQSKQKLRITAELITLLLEYNENPGHNIANKIYPLIDALNHKPDIDTNALINHGLIIIERLPETDEILSKFNSLNIENQIISIKNKVNTLKETQNQNAERFNVFLLICSIYLIFYIIYIFVNLQKSKEKLSESNSNLNDEIGLRTRTEKALYQLVDIDKIHHNDDDRILHLLNALCNALDVEYAYIGRINPSCSSVELLGLLDHGMFSSGIVYPLQDTPCEEVINNGRLVHNNDFNNYFPDSNIGVLSNTKSYIGIRLVDKDEEVIGIIAIASDEAINDSNLAENILTIASSRAIIELQRQVEINNSRRYQQGLS